MKILARLKTLKKLNGNAKWVNKDLFRLVCSGEFAALAHDRLKSRSRRGVVGNDGAPLDETLEERLRMLCESIQNGLYRPRPVRRRLIPRANGKQRALGIVAIRDKVVQEMVRVLLECIYDSPEGPTFSAHSHGFRPTER